MLYPSDGHRTRRARSRSVLALALLALFVFAQFFHLSRHGASPCASALTPSGLYLENGADPPEDCLLCLLLQGLDLSPTAPLTPSPSVEAVAERPATAWAAVAVPTGSVRGPPVSFPCRPPSKGGPSLG